MPIRVNAMFMISAYMVDFAFLEYFYILLPLCNIEYTAGYRVSLFTLVEVSDWSLNKNSSLSADA